MGVLTANPNDLALMLNLIVPLTGALAVACHGPKRLFAVGTMLLSMAAIILTFSRAGFLDAGGNVRPGRRRARAA